MVRLRPEAEESVPTEPGAQTGESAKRKLSDFIAFLTSNIFGESGEGGPEA